VRIELSAEGTKTRFKLVHTGLPDQANADDHQAGWTDFADKSAAIARKAA
jgi:Activator of Hsp90 ATPase homolog 1-like protein